MNQCARSVDVDNFACIDVDRFKRRGFPEVVYCAGKTKQQIKKIAETLLKQKQPLLLTRLDRKTFSYLKKTLPQLKYNSQGKIAHLKLKSKVSRKKKLLVPVNIVGVVCAGTSDIPIAEEAVTTLEVMGNRVMKFYDVGVAGIHRILDKQDLLRECRVIIVIAGMEGALASIVSSLVAVPVVAVPTSIGYGASFSGLAPLLTMLNSCSPGVAVVNIDNGFGAAYLASMINNAHVGIKS